jgi:hypothetical protein
MNTKTLETVQVSAAPHRVDRKLLRWFLPMLSSLLVAGVLIGFAKTFFLRSQFNVPLIPPYLYVHGVILTTWFVLVLAQTFLVATHRTDLHRRLGVAAVVTAGMVVPISALVVARAAQRMGAVHTPLQRLEIVGDLLSLLWFAGFVAAGVYFRRRPDIHKRLMIASCFTIYGPVFARFELVYGVPIPPPAVLPLGLLAIGTYDVVAVRRLHRATLWIAFVWFAGLLPVLGLLMATGAADRLIDALR